MKLRNKQTWEIGYTAVLRSKAIVVMDENAIQLGSYTSLTELNAEWEDYEEPKEYWWIDTGSIPMVRKSNNPILSEDIDKEIGNYFETREEAEKAVEKLKAIQRLKNYYLKFKLDFVKNKIDFTYRLDGTLHSSVDEQRIIFEDMNLLFGGEE